MKKPWKELLFTDHYYTTTDWGHKANHADPWHILDPLMIILAHWPTKPSPSVGRSTGRSTGQSTRRQSMNSQSCLSRHMKGMDLALGNVCNQFEEKLGTVHTFPELFHHIGPESAGTGLSALPLLVGKRCMDLSEVLRWFCHNLFPCRTDLKPFQFDKAILDERPTLLLACGSECLHVLPNCIVPSLALLECVLCVPHCFCGNWLLFGLGQKISTETWNKALVPQNTNMKGFPSEQVVERLGSGVMGLGSVHRSKLYTFYTEPK